MEGSCHDSAQQIKEHKKRNPHLLCLNLFIVNLFFKYTKDYHLEFKRSKRSRPRSSKSRWQLK